MFLKVEGLVGRGGCKTLENGERGMFLWKGRIASVERGMFFEKGTCLGVRS